MKPLGQPSDAQLSCRQVGRLLHAFLDDELHDARAVLVADHLDACLRCGLDASTYRWLKARLGSLSPRDDHRTLARLRAFADALVDEHA